jgi:4-hydroxy-tetrahydrodipicolinate reductase
MRILVLGRGKTGSVVAEVARERGHSVDVLGVAENSNATALTPPYLAGFDLAIDFTQPSAVIGNLRACLSAGTPVVVGTTGWYNSLPEIRQLAERKKTALLYGTNFSVGVQVLYALAHELAQRLGPQQGYVLHITETHHAEKKDSPSGTALTLQKVVAQVGATAEITSIREGDAIGIHTLAAHSDGESLLLQHEAFSRRAFAEGALRGAEWLIGRTGVYDFREIYSQLG